VPVSEKVAEYADRVVAAARAAGLRAEADQRNEKLGYKIREAQLEKIPVVAVVGEREATSNTVAPRTGGATQESIDVDAFVLRTVADARMPGGSS
jgi:threonyl-tRNA synthetase